MLDLLKLAVAFGVGIGTVLKVMGAMGMRLRITLADRPGQPAP